MEKVSPVNSEIYAAFHFIRVEEDEPYEKDKFSSMDDSVLLPVIMNRKPKWDAKPKLNGDLTEEGLYYAQSIDKEF